MSSASPSPARPRKRRRRSLSPSAPLGCQHQRRTRTVDKANSDESHGAQRDDPLCKERIGKNGRRRRRKKAIQERQQGSPSRPIEQPDVIIQKALQKEGDTGKSRRSLELSRCSRSRDTSPRNRGRASTAGVARNEGIKGKGKGKMGDEPAEPKEEPNFEASGLLAMEDNSKNGIPLKFTKPPEARLPTMKWRLYIFTKQSEAPKVVHMHRFVGYLFGKDRRIVDIPTDHPTCSKQHAVLHYRLAAVGEVKPYIMDLESTNGTFLNGERIEPARYYEMRERDVLKFGMSSREFVLLHSGSANDMPVDSGMLQKSIEA